jgi:rhodanese-related sulfurtransferase
MSQYTEFVFNHPFLFGALAVVLYMLGVNLFNALITGVKRVTPAEATRLINREEAMVLDIRSKADFKKGHIVGALNMPMSEMPNRLQELDGLHERPLVICCADGFGAPDAVKPLKTAGFAKLYQLLGGIGEWRSANFPLTKD